MSKVFDYLKQNVKADQRVWVRSTPYGHAKCSQYTSPSSHIVTPTGQQGEYEWDMFEQFDFVWKVVYKNLVVDRTTPLNMCVFFSSSIGHD